MRRNESISGDNACRIIKCVAWPLAVSGNLVRLVALPGKNVIVLAMAPAPSLCRVLSLRELDRIKYSDRGKAISIMRGEMSSRIPAKRS
jgi:hypothetical protein